MRDLGGIGIERLLRNFVILGSANNPRAKERNSENIMVRKSQRIAKSPLHVIAAFLLRSRETQLAKINQLSQQVDELQSQVEQQQQQQQQIQQKQEINTLTRRAVEAERQRDHGGLISYLLQRTVSPPNVEGAAAEWQKMGVPYRFPYRFIWPEPDRPKWMDGETYARMPKSLQRRLIHVKVAESGFRTESIDTERIKES